MKEKQSLEKIAIPVHEDKPDLLLEPESNGNGAATGRGRTTYRVRRKRNLEELREHVYGFTDLSTYSVKERLLVRLADIFFTILIKLICSTLRWEVEGASNLDGVHSKGNRAIFTFWHCCIFTATWFWRNRGIVVMSSRSRDGEYTGRFIKRFGYGTARGSSSRGAGRALAEMAECLSSDIDVAFTIDGPRGPAYVAKTGAITLARHTEQAILPFHIGVKRYVTLPSWDGLQIPLPFSRALTLVGAPIYIGRNAGFEEIEAGQAMLQESLDAMRRRADLWRDGRR